MTRGLLAQLPDLPGILLAARYRPAGDAPIGGDWYDLVPLADGRLVISLGDVAGHGLDVAPVMAQLRRALRADLHAGTAPADAVGRLDALVHEAFPRELATVVVAEFDPGTGRLRLANAGHLPPLVVAPDATPRLVDTDRGPALGLTDDATYAETEIVLRRGTTLVLYSDGLVEHRGEPLDESLARLLAIAASPGDDLESLCDRLVERADRDDDVTLLALRAG